MRRTMAGASGRWCTSSSLRPSQAAYWWLKLILVILVITSTCPTRRQFSAELGSVHPSVSHDVLTSNRYNPQPISS